MRDRLLLEQSLVLYRGRDGSWASQGTLARRAVMHELCPEISGGYRWSATANYLGACQRAAKAGRAQPSSRGRLSAVDRARIWELVLAAHAFWQELVHESGADNYSHDTLTREQLLRTELGRELFAVKPQLRARPSALAA